MQAYKEKQQILKEKLVQAQKLPDGLERSRRERNILSALDAMKRGLDVVLPSEDAAYADPIFDYFYYAGKKGPDLVAVNLHRQFSVKDRFFLIVEDRHIPLEEKEQHLLALAKEADTELREEIRAWVEYQKATLAFLESKNTYKDVVFVAEHKKGFFHGSDVQGIYPSLTEALEKESVCNQISIYQVGGSRIGTVWRSRRQTEPWYAGEMAITSIGLHASKLGEEAPQFGRKLSIASHVLELTHPFQPFDLLRHFSGDRMYAVVADQRETNVAEVMERERGSWHSDRGSIKLDMPIWYLETSPCESVPQGAVQTRFYYEYFPYGLIDWLLAIYIPEEERLPWQVEYVAEIRRQLVDKE